MTAAAASALVVISAQRRVNANAAVITAAVINAVKSGSLAIDSYTGTQPNCSVNPGRVSAMNSIIAGGNVAITTERQSVIKAVRSPSRITFTATSAIPIPRGERATASSAGYPGGKCDDGT